MRRWVVILVTVVLVTVAVAGCHDGTRHTASNPSSSVAPSSEVSTTSTTIASTTTTASPLSFIAGCPDPGPLAEPDPHRPRYEATVDVDPPSSTVAGSMVVTFTPDLPVQEVIFRLWPNAPVPAAAGSHMVVDHVTD